MSRDYDYVEVPTPRRENTPKHMAQTFTSSAKSYDDLTRNSVVGKVRAAERLQATRLRRENTRRHFDAMAKSTAGLRNSASIRDRWPAWYPTYLKPEFLAALDAAEKAQRAKGRPHAR